MRVRVPVLASVLLVVLASPAAAMPERLSGAQIKQWIDGNTVVGVWAGTAYRQLFRSNGTTTYDAQGAARDEGRWWVTDTEYCSWWSGSGEACYQVLRKGRYLDLAHQRLVQPLVRSQRSVGRSVGG